MCNRTTPDKVHNKRKCIGCIFYSEELNRAGQWPCELEYLPDESGDCPYFKEFI